MAAMNPAQQLSPEQALAEWEDAQRNLAFWKEKENKARISAIEGFFQEPPESGTQTVQLQNGWKLKAVFKQNINIAKGDPLEKVLTQIENPPRKPGQSDAEYAEECGRNKLIAQRVIRWKPELDKREYDAMPSDLRAILDTVISTTPGTPSLELVEPKARG